MTTQASKAAPVNVGEDVTRVQARISHRLELIRKTVDVFAEDVKSCGGDEKTAKFIAAHIHRIDKILVEALKSMAGEYLPVIR